MKKYRGLITSFVILCITSYIMFDIAPDPQFLEATGGGEGSVFAYLGCVILFGAALVAFLWQFHQLRSPSRDRRELIEQSLISHTAALTNTHRFTVEQKYIEELLLTQAPVEIPLLPALHSAAVNDVIELTDQSQQPSIFVTITDRNNTTVTVTLTKRPIEG